MKTLFIILFLTISNPALAQTIVKVDGDRVTVSIPDGKSLELGQKIDFLDGNLDVKATGLVEKTSPQGRSAIVRVKSGKVDTSHTIEVSKSAESSPQTQTQPAASTLSEEDRKILDRGEIGTTAYVIGGVLGTYPLGLGIGHAIQGRYSSMGWIFTVGELGSVAVLYSAALDCAASSSYWSNNGECGNKGVIFLGALAFVGFRIWEIIDLWAAPPEHNRRYRELKGRTSQANLGPVLISRRGETLLGLQYRF